MHGKMIIKFDSQKHATEVIIQMKQSKAYDLTLHKQNYIYICTCRCNLFL